MGKLHFPLFFHVGDLVDTFLNDLKLVSNSAFFSNPIEEKIWPYYDLMNFKLNPKMNLHRQYFFKHPRVGMVEFLDFPHPFVHLLMPYSNQSPLPPLSNLFHNRRSFKVNY